MTGEQIKLIHLAAKDVGLDDAQYRLLLKNVAKVESCKQLTNAQFEDVMAVLEEMGFTRERAWHRDKASFTGSGGSATRVQSTYWRDKVAARSLAGNARQLYLIHQLAPLTDYKLPGLVYRFSKGRTDQVEQLKPQEAWQLIEMLKATVARSSPIQNRKSPRGKIENSYGAAGKGLFDGPGEGPPAQDERAARMASK